MTRAEHVAALTEDPQGVQLDLIVSPGAAAASFPDRFDPWRKRIGIRVQAAAEKGHANQEVVRLVAGFFGRGEGDVHIIRGTTASRKTVIIEGIDLEQAIKRLSGGLK